MSTVRDYLLHQTQTGDFVQFVSGGWPIGCTKIDSEDLFIQSLNENLLEQEVLFTETKKDPFIGHTVIEVNVNPVR